MTNSLNFLITLASKFSNKATPNQQKKEFKIEKTQIFLKCFNQRYFYLFFVLWRNIGRRDAAQALTYHCIYARTLKKLVEVN